MDSNLIISENNPEDVQMFLGDELYIVEESQWYAEISSEGGNKFRFLNIVSHSGEEIIPKKQRDFFFRMTNAIQTERIKMDADGFAVINVLKNKGLKWKNIEQIFSPKYCIFWGVDPNKMDVPCKLYGGVVHDDCRIIYMPSMEQVFENIELKTKLWAFVKRMFGIDKAEKNG